MSYTDDVMQSLSYNIRNLNNNLSGLNNLSSNLEELGNLGSSLEDLQDLNENLKALTSLTEREMFRQEWNEAIEYFKQKRPGALPSDEIIINRIIESRRLEEQRYNKVKRLTR